MMDEHRENGWITHPETCVVCAFRLRWLHDLTAKLPRWAMNRHFHGHLNSHQEQVAMERVRFSLANLSWRDWDFHGEWCSGWPYCADGNY